MSAAHAPVVSTTWSARTAPCSVRTIAGRDSVERAHRRALEDVDAALEEQPAQAPREPSRLHDRVVAEERALDEPR